MAHWEERDPRWVVKERGKEGTNVNGWHWEERSLKKEARSKLDDLFKDIDAEINPSIGRAKITAITEMSGEAYMTRRKGNKTLIVYDLCLTLHWLGKLAEEENEVTGTMKCTEVTLGSDEDDYIITVTCDKDEQKHSHLVDAIKRLRPAVVKRLLQFDQEFKNLQQ